MWNVSARTAFAVSCAVVSFGFQAHAEGVDIGALNKALAKIVSASLTKHKGEPNPVYKDLQLKIVENGTVLDSEDIFKAKISVKATADKEKVIWSKNADTSVVLDASFGADRKRKEVYAGLKGTIETDSLGLAKFAARALTRDYCKAEETEATKKQACEAIKGVAAAKDIPEVFSFLAKLATLGVADLEQQLVIAKKELETAPEQTKVFIEKRIEGLKKSIEVAKTLDVQFQKAVKDGAEKQQYTVKLDALATGTYGDVRDLELYIDKNKVELSLRWTMRDVEDMDTYFALKPEVEKILVSVQNGDEEAEKSIQQFLDQYVKITKDFVSKE